MNEYLHRLSTFEDWPSDVSPLPLATCGFFYTGHDDVVQCYRCSLTLRNWRRGDSPLVRHQRSNPDCPVATNTDTLNATVLTAHDLQQPISSLEADDVRGIIPSVIRSSPDELSLQNLRMCSFRLKTFHDWPKSHIVTAVSLARAGFYYIGYDDTVRCAFCRREVSDWQPGDKPTEEHRRLVPYCAFVKQNFCFPTQSSATSHRAASELQQQHANEQAQPARKTLAEIKEENEMIRRKTECAVCLENKINRVLIPCGHPLCSECLGKLQNPHCHMCRKLIGDVCHVKLP